MTETTDETAAQTPTDGDEPIQLGRYTIHELLGTGGMAEIFRASVTGPQQFAKWVVVKRVKRKFAEQQVFVQMFIDEARINAALDHANIVSVFDFGERDGHYYMAMEYIDGIDLQVAHVRHKERHGKPLPWEAAVLVMRDVLRGLDYAHNATDNDGAPLGIIHRDVNLVNVMIRRDGAVKLLDFGCAKASSAIRRSQTQVGVIKGKLGYMSPEQTEDRDLDPRTDVFSAGIVLHELLTGRRLFWGDSELEMLRAVRSKPIPDPRKYSPQLPESLVDVVLKALARDRDQRYASASDMADELETIILEHRIPMSRTRQLMGELMAADAPPEQRDVTPRQRKVTVVTWMNIPVHDPPPQRMVSGDLVSLDDDAPEPEPQLEASPAITTDQAWALGDADADPSSVDDDDELAAPNASDEGKPTQKWSAVSADKNDVTQPVQIPLEPDPAGIGSASKALLAIILLFVVVAVIVGLWIFTG